MSSISMSTSRETVSLFGDSGDRLAGTRLLCRINGGYVEVAFLGVYMQEFHLQLVSIDDARGMERSEIAMLRNEIAGDFAK